MNKIFKVVWNKARCCYVVASEFAKSRTKSGRAVKGAAVAVAAALTLGMNGLVLAADDTAPNNPGKGEGVAIGGENYKDNDTGDTIDTRAYAKSVTDVAIGAGAEAYGDEYVDEEGTHSGNATAVGHDAKATNVNGTAIGHSANASGIDSTAVGVAAKASKNGSTAVGTGAEATGESGAAFGNHAHANGDYSTALGVTAVAEGTSSTALGNAAHAEGEDSTALGTGAKALGEGSIAVGTSAKANAQKVTLSDGTVVFESNGFTNGTAMGNKAEAIGDASTALGVTAVAEGKSSTALGNAAYAKGESSTALGVSAKAEGKNSTALGYGATATALGSTALGTSAQAKGVYSIASGENATAIGEHSVAIGYGTQAGSYNEKDNTILGYSMAIGDLAKATGASSISLGASSEATGYANTAIGREAKAYAWQSTAIGLKATASGGNSIVLGSNASTSSGAEYSIAIGMSAKTSSANNVALGASSNDTNGKKGYADKTNPNETVFALSNNALAITLSQFAGTGNSVVGTVSVGSVGNERTITNVAAGMISATSTDAINGSQLYAVAKGLQEQIDKIDNSGTGGDHYHTVNGKDPKPDTNDSVGDGSGSFNGGDTSGSGATNNAASGSTGGTAPTGDKPELNQGYVSSKGNLSIQYAIDENNNKYYDISMNKDIDLGPDGSITIGDTYIKNNQINLGNKVSITDNSVKVGDITINEGNIDMGGNKIINVANGTDDNDAVNYSQLKELNQHVTNNSVQINKLKGRIDKVGAGAAALAALHPLDFDPDDKFYLSAGYGNYRGENAVAVGAFYQPNDDTLFSVSSTVGNDDDMINAGITWRFGQSSHQSRSKKAMAKEIIELRTEVAELKAMVYSLTGYGLDLEKSKLFPDTPENHWAYDYVAVVAGNGILEGYPNGKFDGSRPMTRYEMAAVVYRLLQKGVQVDNRMIQEFAPELARVRVDTLTHYNDGTPHIQRVRVIEGRG